MANMSNFFNLDNPNCTVGDILQGSYDVVKEVYLELPTLKKLSKDTDLNFIKENFNVIRNVNNNVSTINNVNNNLNSILNVTDTKNQIDERLKQSEEQSKKLIEDANKSADKIIALSNDLQTNLDKVLGMSEEIRICSDNSTHIRVDSENIESIITVAEYLTNTLDNTIIPTDLGVIGTSNGNIPDTSPLEIIARNIQALLDIYNQLDIIVKFASDGSIQKLLELSAKLENSIEEINNISAQIKDYLKQIDAKIIEFDKKYLQYLDNINDIILNFNKELAKQLEEINKLLEQAKQIKDECISIRNDCEKYYLYILKLSADVNTSLTNLYNKSISDFKLVTNDYIQNNINNIYDTINIEKDNINKYLQNALDNFKKEIDKAIKDALDNLEINLGSVYKYRGEVATYNDLLTLQSLKVGDVYNVNDTDCNYAWTGSRWDSLGVGVAYIGKGN